MVINNTNDAFENLLIGDSKCIKLKITTEITAVFYMDDYDTVKLSFETIPKDENDDVKIVSNKIHLRDFMNIQNSIDYILENLENLLNEYFRISNIGITRWKNSNCIEYTSIDK